ncbi:MAG: hypothetical protein NZ455_01350 [Bacteroidia bacterium]|nr:hypothetical protein [Bacteroidia bacterium]MDW8346529.1 hypothetical protein [Bacteroidia bacterium]
MGVSLRFARVGLLRTTRSLRCYANASHCLTACSISLTQRSLHILPCFYIYLCFTLFNVHYQVLTKLNFLPCLNCIRFILFYIDFQLFTRLNLECTDF